MKKRLLPLLLPALTALFLIAATPSLADAPAAAPTTAPGTNPTSDTNTAPPILAIPVPDLRLSPLVVEDSGGATKTLDIPWLAQYISGVYQYGVSLAGILATVMFIIGGFQYMTAGGDAARVTAAKKRITDAMVGLLLSVGAYMVLYTINPDLVTFQALRIQTVKKNPFVANTDMSTTDTNVITDVPPPPGSPPGTPPTKVATSEVDGAAPPITGCFRKTFGASDADVQKNIVNVTFLGNKIQVNQVSAGDWQAAFSELEAQPPDSPVGKWMAEIKAMPWYSPTCAGGSAFGGGYVQRIAKHDAKVDALKTTNAQLIADGKPPKYVGGDSSDLHMFGLAVDIDPCRNPWVHNSQLKTSMPPELPALMATHKLYWGGLGWKHGTQKIGTMWPQDPNFVGDHDAMHFEWHGACW